MRKKMPVLNLLRNFMWEVSFSFRPRQAMGLPRWIPARAGMTTRGEEAFHGSLWPLGHDR